MLWLFIAVDPQFVVQTRPITDVTYDAHLGSWYMILAVQPSVCDESLVADGYAQFADDFKEQPRHPAVVSSAMLVAENTRIQGTVISRRRAWRRVAGTSAAAAVDAGELCSDWVPTLMMRRGRGCCSFCHRRFLSSTWFVL